jgi:hypothetical protein
VALLLYLLCRYLYLTFSEGAAHIIDYYILSTGTYLLRWLVSTSCN